VASRDAMIGWPMLVAANPHCELNGQLTLIASMRPVTDEIYCAAANPLHFIKQTRKPWV
jgi:hypothetical protein